MQHEITLQDILRIEEDLDVVNIVCPNTDILVWPLIRIEVIRHVIWSLLYDQPADHPEVSMLSLGRIALQLSNSIIHNMGVGKITPSQVQIHCTGEGSYISGQVLDDRIVGDVARACPGRVNIYQQAPKSHLSVNSNYGFVRYGTPRIAIEQIMGRIFQSRTARQISHDTLERVFKYIDNIFHIKMPNRTQNWLKQRLASRITMLPYSIAWWERQFELTKPKVLFKENASYGGRAIPVIIAAKRKGIVVAELQHGLISKGHDAYNVSQIFEHNAAYSRILPEYILTYGDWWSAQTNLPTKKLSLGNPHRSEQLKIAVKNESNRKNILLLSDGFDLDKYIELAKVLHPAAMKLGLSVVIRPHPRERAKAEAKLISEGLIVDKFDTIYSSFLSAKILISELSTGLFEAIGLVPTIFNWRTQKANFTIPDSPFEQFSNPSDLYEILAKKKFHDNNTTINPLDFWAEDWRSNLRNFLQENLK